MVEKYEMLSERKGFRMWFEGCRLAAGDDWAQRAVALAVRLRVVSVH